VLDFVYYSTFIMAYGMLEINGINV